jgi:hypothetical protein
MDRQGIGQRDHNLRMFIEGVNEVFRVLGVDPADLTNADPGPGKRTFNQWRELRDALLEAIAEGASSGQAGIADVVLSRFRLVPVGERSEQ